jgi:hypothetical protein
MRNLGGILGGVEFAISTNSIILFGEGVRGILGGVEFDISKFYYSIGCSGMRNLGRS